MDCSTSGSSVHGVFKSRILEWVAMPSSRGSSQPRDQTQVSWIVGRFFTVWTRGKPRNTGVGVLSLPESSRPRVSCIAGRFFTSWATREAQWWRQGTSKIEKRRAMAVRRKGKVDSGVTFWLNENDLTLLWWLHVSGNILKSSELCTLNRWIVWYIDYISIKLL